MEEIEKLTEGHTYLFLFVKNTRLPNGETAMVLQDPMAKRHLLVKKAYEHYGFTLGDKIWCTITRVSCSGQVSIEPEHPFYKWGDIYPFNFVRMELEQEPMQNRWTIKLSQKKDYRIIVADKYGIEHIVKPNPLQNKPRYKTKTINCRIIKITNGNFHLENIS